MAKIGLNLLRFLKKVLDNKKENLYIEPLNYRKPDGAI
jgi:hypothetical protein